MFSLYLYAEKRRKKKLMILRHLVSVFDTLGLLWNSVPGVCGLYALLFVCKVALGTQFILSFEFVLASGSKCFRTVKDSNPTWSNLPFIMCSLCYSRAVKEHSPGW